VREYIGFNDRHRHIIDNFWDDFYWPYTLPCQSNEGQNVC